MPSSVRFRFVEVVRELTFLFEATKKRYFDTSAETVFPRLIQGLELLQSAGTSAPMRWEVLEHEPLRTVETNRYEPGQRRGALGIAARKG
jgi:hypothetical protein